MDTMKKGMTEQMKIDQKKPQKTDEATQRPLQQDTKVSADGKGKVTVRK